MLVKLVRVRIFFSRRTRVKVWSNPNYLPIIHYHVTDCLTRTWEQYKYKGQNALSLQGQRRLSLQSQHLLLLRYWCETFNEDSLFDEFFWSIILFQVLWPSFFLYNSEWFFRNYNREGFFFMLAGLLFLRGLVDLLILMS